MGSWELIVRLRRSEQTHEIICRLSVSYDHTCGCLRCMSEAVRWVRLKSVHVAFEFVVVLQFYFCSMATFVDNGVHYTSEYGRLSVTLNICFHPSRVCVCTREVLFIHSQLASSFQTRTIATYIEH